jgi:hypothetical protein
MREVILRDVERGSAAARVETSRACGIDRCELSAVGTDA